MNQVLAIYSLFTLHFVLKHIDELKFILIEYDTNRYQKQYLSFVCIYFIDYENV